MFFNFAGYAAEDWWARRSFVGSWWRGNARDRRWTPPVYNALYRAIVRRQEPHLQRLAGPSLTLEAMPSPASRGTSAAFGMAVALHDAVVAMTLPLVDARTNPRTTFLAMMTFANDDETLERLLQLVWERTAESGSRRLVGPAPLAPAFAHGALMDHFHLPPPLHTPYNAPYVPELLEDVLEPLATSRLWSIDLDVYRPRLDAPGFAAAEIVPERLAGDLLPLVSATLAAGGERGAPVLPDALEMEFALRSWAAAGPLLALAVEDEGQVVGWALAQADRSATLRRLQGGRPLWARALLPARVAARVQSGRLLLGGVAASHQGRGIGRALLDALVEQARPLGWRTLSIGPVYDETPAAAFLQSVGATARQRYTLFAAEG